MTADFECPRCGMQSDDEGEMVGHILARHPGHVVLVDGPAGPSVGVTA